MAAHIALHEAGAAFEARPLSFRRREHRSPAYLALNPAGQVPTLLIDGRPLTEVAAILFFLARRFPEGAEAEAQALSWTSFAASTLHPARRGGLDHAMSAWTVAENRMAGSGWLLGRYSVADMHLFRLFWRFNPSLRPDLAVFPNLDSDWTEQRVHTMAATVYLLCVMAQAVSGAPGPANAGIARCPNQTLCRQPFPPST